MTKMKNFAKYWNKVWCYPNKNYYFWVTLLLYNLKLWDILDSTRR